MNVSTVNHEKCVLNVARKPIALTMAKVEPVRSIHNLIRVFAMVASRHFQWRLRDVDPITNEGYFRELTKLRTN
jgi:hypothetical protein